MAKKQLPHTRTSKKGKTFIAGSPKQYKLMDLFDRWGALQRGPVETKSTRTFNIPGSNIKVGNVKIDGRDNPELKRGFRKILDNTKPTKIVEEKPLFPAGHIRDLFKPGKRLKIINFQGEVVRDIRLEKGHARISPKIGEVIWVPIETDVLLEEWLMAQPSLLFRAPPTAPLNLRNQILKLGVENDKVVYY